MVMMFKKIVGVVYKVSAVPTGRAFPRSSSADPQRVRFYLSAQKAVLAESARLYAVQVSCEADLKRGVDALAKAETELSRFQEKLQRRRADATSDAQHVRKLEHTVEKKIGKVLDLKAEVDRLQLAVQAVGSQEGLATLKQLMAKATELALTPSASRFPSQSEELLADEVGAPANHARGGGNASSRRLLGLLVLASYIPGVGAPSVVTPSSVGALLSSISDTVNNVYFAHLNYDPSWFPGMDGALDSLNEFVSNSGTLLLKLSQTQLEALNSVCLSVANRLLDTDYSSGYRQLYLIWDNFNISSFPPLYPEADRAFFGSVNGLLKEMVSVFSVISTSGEISATALNNGLTALANFVSTPFGQGGGGNIGDIISGILNPVPPADGGGGQSIEDGGSQSTLLPGIAKGISGLTLGLGSAALVFAGLQLVIFGANRRDRRDNHALCQALRKEQTLTDAIMNERLSPVATAGAVRVMLTHPGAFSYSTHKALGLVARVASEGAVNAFLSHRPTPEGGTRSAELCQLINLRLLPMELPDEISGRFVLMVMIIASQHLNREHSGIYLNQVHSEEEAFTLISDAINRGFAAVEPLISALSKESLNYREFNDRSSVINLALRTLFSSDGLDLRDYRTSGSLLQKAGNVTTLLGTHGWRNQPADKAIIAQFCTACVDEVRCQLIAAGASTRGPSYAWGRQASASNTDVLYLNESSLDRASATVVDEARPQETSGIRFDGLRLLDNVIRYLSGHAQPQLVGSVSFATIGLFSGVVTGGVAELESRPLRVGTTFLEFANPIFEESGNTVDTPSDRTPPPTRRASQEPALQSGIDAVVATPPRREKAAAVLSPGTELYDEDGKKYVVGGHDSDLPPSYASATRDGVAANLVTMAADGYSGHDGFCRGLQIRLGKENLTLPRAIVVTLDSSGLAGKRIVFIRDRSVPSWANFEGWVPKYQILRTHQDGHHDVADLPKDEEALIVAANVELLRIFLPTISNEPRFSIDGKIFNFKSGEATLEDCLSQSGEVRICRGGHPVLYVSYLQGEFKAHQPEKYGMD